MDEKKSNYDNAIFRLTVPTNLKETAPDHYECDLRFGGDHAAFYNYVKEYVAGLEFASFKYLERAIRNAPNGNRLSFRIDYSQSEKTGTVRLDELTVFGEGEITATISVCAPSRP